MQISKHFIPFSFLSLFLFFILFAVACFSVAAQNNDNKYAQYQLEAEDASSSQKKKTVEEQEEEENEEQEELEMATQNYPQNHNFGNKLFSESRGNAPLNLYEDTTMQWTAEDEGQPSDSPNAAATAARAARAAARTAQGSAGSKSNHQTTVSTTRRQKHSGADAQNRGNNKSNKQNYQKDKYANGIGDNENDEDEDEDLALEENGENEDDDENDELGDEEPDVSSAASFHGREKTKKTHTTKKLHNYIDIDEAVEIEEDKSSIPFVDRIRSLFKTIKEKCFRRSSRSALKLPATKTSVSIDKQKIKQAHGILRSLCSHLELSADAIFRTFRSNSEKYDEFLEEADEYLDLNHELETAITSATSYLNKLVLKHFFYKDKKSEMQWLMDILHGLSGRIGLCKKISHDMKVSHSNLLSIVKELDGASTSPQQNNDGKTAMMGKNKAQKVKENAVVLPYSVS